MSLQTTEAPTQPQIIDQQQLQREQAARDLNLWNLGQLALDSRIRERIERFNPTAFSGPLLRATTEV